MKRNDLLYIKKWFSDYSKSFYTDNHDDNKNILLKEHHTLNVCDNIKEIAGKIIISQNEKLLAEAVAILHDVGRFPQYAKYKTFKDNKSENHGVLGAKTLIKERVLKNLPKKEQEIIIETVRFHNTYKIPAGQLPEMIKLLKLIRDADKLDIWRVFIEYYEQTDNERASAVALGFPDTQEYSKDIIKYIYEKRMVSLSKVNTLSEYKILQLTWIYDINYKATLELFLERKYIDRISDHLPHTKEIKNSIGFIKEFLQTSLVAKAEQK